MCVDRPVVRLRRDEDGVALIAVLLAVIVLFGLSVVFVATATFESRSTAGSRDYESVMHVAEAAVDDLIPSINADPIFCSSRTHAGSACDETGDDGTAYELDELEDGSSPGSEIRRLGEEADESQIIRTPEGEGFAVRPIHNGEPSDEIWAVGWVPNREDPQRVRALRLRFDHLRYRPEFGLFTGGALHLSGSAQIRGDFGHVHTNGTAVVSGTSYSVEGNFSSVGSPLPASCEDRTAGSCVAGAAPQPVPNIDAGEAYRLRNETTAPWLDLCPPVGTTPATIRPWSAGGPCTGEPVLWTSGDTVSFQGWRYQLGQWRTHTTPHEGVYYVHERNATVGSMSSARPVTVIVEAKDDNDGDSSGNIYVGPAQMKSALSGLTLVADRDIEVTGNAYIEGLVAAREQIRVSASSFRVRGAIVAQDAPNTPGSPVSSSSVHALEIIYDDQLHVPLTGVIRITSWNELRGG